MLSALASFGKDVFETFLGDTGVGKVFFAAVFPIFWILFIMFTILGSLAKYAHSKKDAIPNAVKWILGGLSFGVLRVIEITRK